MKQNAGSKGQIDIEFDVLQVLLLEGTQNAVGLHQQFYVLFFELFDVLELHVGETVAVAAFEVGVHEFYDAEVAQVGQDGNQLRSGLDESAQKGLELPHCAEMGVVSVVLSQAVKHDLVGRREVVEVLGEGVVVDPLVGPRQDFERNLLFRYVLSLVLYQESSDGLSQDEEALSYVAGTLGDLLADIGQ